MCPLSAEKTKQQVQLRVNDWLTKLQSRVLVKWTQENLENQNKVVAGRKARAQLGKNTWQSVEPEYLDNFGIPAVGEIITQVMMNEEDGEEGLEEEEEEDQRRLEWQQRRMGDSNDPESETEVEE